MKILVCEAPFEREFMVDADTMKILVEKYDAVVGEQCVRLSGKDVRRWCYIVARDKASAEEVRKILQSRITGVKEIDSQFGRVGRVLFEVAISAKTLTSLFLRDMQEIIFYHPSNDIEW